MNKGFKTTLLAVAASLAGISSSFASAPVISALPDVWIGDAENNIGTDNNLFVFTNAFEFDAHANDADTTVSELTWSFDEGDNPLGGATQWFTVNGVNPIHVGTAAQAADLNAANDHVAPAQDLRDLTADGSTLGWASFRDIVLSPPPGTNFPAPSANHEHKTGKVVTFWVSDGTNTTSQSILVKIVDNATDFASPNFVVSYENINTFSTADGWVATHGNTAAPTLTSTAHDTANTELEATVGANGMSQGTPGSAQEEAYYNNHRIIGWLEKNAADTPGDADSMHLTYSEAGTNFVRAKFHLYATGQTTNDLNEVPNLRLRVTSRFAFASVLDVLHHQFFDPANNNISDDLTPSKNAASPSVYRVDFDPPENLAYVASNPGEGLQRMWEAFAPGYEPAQNGTIACTESSIGTYPAYDLTGTATKVYTGADFAQSNIYYVLDRYSRGATLTHTAKNTNGTNNLGTIAGSEMGATGSSSAMTLYTTGVADTSIGIVAVDFLNGTVADAADNRLRVRVEAGKVYAVTYRVTSTVPSTQTSWYRLRVRTVKFGISQRLELDGAYQQTDTQDNTRPGHILAQQYAPSTTPKNYTVLVNSPIDPEINASQPDLTGQVGPGAGSQTGQTSRRDLYPAADIIDSISGSYWDATKPDFEKGHIVIDRIEIRTFDRADD